jgi:hypothetical protein
MGHYDSCYAAEAEETQKKVNKLISLRKKGLKKMGFSASQTEYII